MLEMPVRNKPVTSSEKAFEEWYERAFPHVARFVRKMGGSFQDAKDIFHDALVIFYEKTKEESFHLKTAEEAYILGIAKHLWIRKFNKDKNTISLDNHEAAISIPNDYFPDVDSKRLLTLLEETGKKCLQLLRSFYYEKLSLKEITDQLGYRSVHSATVRKYKCLEKLRDNVKEKSINYEDFME
ncbi:MAG TPA: sigma-70 family RNA polymerase sigma factor [Cytophagaceae bacterium]|jgi:RNA polymerase sigma factor (sigma-70 family)|nr:sigma-70 family RNA polymerase sigma factor [Cytophagaceae bacterium]